MTVLWKDNEHITFRCDKCGACIERPIHEALVCPHCNIEQLHPSPDKIMNSKGEIERRKAERQRLAKEGAKELGVNWVDALHYVTALYKWAKKGFPTRSQEEADRIYETFCEPCDHIIKGRCRLCGCNVNKGIALRNKVKMETESCPVNFW